MATVVSTLPTLPFALQALGGDPAQTYNAVDFRYLVGSLWQRAGRLGEYSGFWVFPNQAGANWSIDVSAGQAAVGGSGTMERFLVTLPTRTNISVSTFNTAPTATRTHAVWLVVDDKNVAPSVGYAARIIVTEDTGSGAPTPAATSPAYPFYLKLATFTISSGQSNINTANITQVSARGDRKATLSNLPLNSGFTAGPQAPAYSLVGNTVQFQGTVNSTTPLAINSGTVEFVGTAGTMPTGIRPAVARYAVVTAISGPQFARLVISTIGTMSVATAGFNTTTMGAFSLDSISYEIG